MSKNFYEVYFACALLCLYGIPALVTYARYKTKSPLLSWTAIKEELTIGMMIYTVVVAFIPIINLLVVAFMLANAACDALELLFRYNWLRYKPFASKK